MLRAIAKGLASIGDGLLSIGEGLATIFAPPRTSHRIERHWTLTEQGRIIYHGTDIPHGFEEDFARLEEDFERMAEDWDRLAQDGSQIDPLDSSGIVGMSKRSAERMRKQAARLRKKVRPNASR